MGDFTTRCQESNLSGVVLAVVTITKTYPQVSFEKASDRLQVTVVGCQVRGGTHSSSCPSFTSSSLWGVKLMDDVVIIIIVITLILLLVGSEGDGHQRVERPIRHCSSPQHGALKS